jgi:hypothetical protein
MPTSGVPTMRLPCIITGAILRPSCELQESGAACVRKQEAATIDLTPVCPCEVVKRVLALNAADRSQCTGGHSKRPTPPTPDASRSSRTPATMALQKRCGRHEPFGS